MTLKLQNWSTTMFAGLSVVDAGKMMGLSQAAAYKPGSLPAFGFPLGSKSRIRRARTGIPIPA